MKSEYKTTPCIYCNSTTLRRMQDGDWDASKRHKLSTMGKRDLQHQSITYNPDVFDYYICDSCWRISMCHTGEKVE